MQILKTVAISALALTVVALGAAAMMPSAFQVRRSVLVASPVDVVFPLVANLPQWRGWEPFTAADPSVRSSFAGESGTVGSSWSWSGDSTGRGSLTIREIIPGRRVRSELHFLGLQPMTATDLWTLEPTDGGTKVTWEIEGNLSYPLNRLMGPLVVRMLGPKYEKGLRNLKTACESAGRPSIERAALSN